jgi:phospholipid transport system transporter-binding protein
VTAAFRIERIDAGHVRVSGRLGFAEAADALAQEGELTDADGRDVTVDIAALERVDSATLAVLLAWSARARIRGDALRFAGAPAGLMALAHLCDAEPLLGIA